MTSRPRLPPLLSQAPPSTPPLRRHHLRSRAVRPRQPLRRSFLCPPRRRPASGQSPHATPVRRLLTQLLQLPRPSSTPCPTLLSNIPRLVRPRRRRRRPLRLSRRHPPYCRPANQPSHATLMCRLVTRLLPLPLLSSETTTTTQFTVSSKNLGAAHWLSAARRLRASIYCEVHARPTMMNPESKPSLSSSPSAPPRRTLFRGVLHACPLRATRLPYAAQ